MDNVATTPARVFDLKINSEPTSATVDGMTILRRPDGTPYNGADFDGEGLVVERATGPSSRPPSGSRRLALGGPLPGGRRQLYLMSDDNNGATQITRFYSLAVDLH